MKYLIVNADDFGASTGINRGIVEAHRHGVVTSTSFMVTGHAVAEAVALSRECPGLSIGLHWDVWGEDEHAFDIEDLPAVRNEFHRQVEAFERLFSRRPTHVDSHRHAHRDQRAMPLFRELVAQLGVPLRHDGAVHFVGGFYGQWEWMVTNLHYVSVEFFEQLLRDEVGTGWTELACHPGFASPGFSSVYLAEREVEVKTLTDPRLRPLMTELGIELVSYDDYARLAGPARGGGEARR